MDTGGTSTIDLGFDFSGLTLRLEGLRPEMAARLGRDWAGFESPVADEPFLHGRIHIEGDCAISSQGYRPKAMTAKLGPAGARYAMREGEAHVDAHGLARVRLARTGDDRDYFTLLNLLRACLAWRMPSRGGVLLHAAGIVVGERAFVLTGPEGSGKSSWARLGEQCGGHVLSDDVVLLDGQGSSVEALASPLRSTHVIHHRPGRWPLAAILFPRKAADAGYDPVSSMVAQARIAANLPFVADGLGDDERIGSAIERLVREIRCADLRFALDGAFVDLLRRWPHGGGAGDVLQ